MPRSRAAGEAHDHRRAGTGLPRPSFALIGRGVNFATGGLVEGENDNASSSRADPGFSHAFAGACVRTATQPVTGRATPAIIRGTRFSPLKQITPANVGGLTTAWSMRVAPQGGGALASSATPIVVGGLMYYPTGIGGAGAGAGDRQGGLAPSGDRRRGAAFGQLLARRQGA